MAMSKRSLKRWLFVSAIVGAVGFPVLDARAAEVQSQVIIHEGRLFDAAGAPLDGFKRITFTLYPTKVGGAALWTETAEVEFAEGYFDARLGEVTPIGASLLDGETRWLAIAGGVPAGAVGRIAVASRVHPNLARDEGGTRAAPREEAQREPEAVAPAPAPAPAPGAAQRPAGVVLSIGAAEAAIAPLANERGRAFIGDTVGMSVEATHLAFISANVGLGSTVPGGAGDLELSICTRQIGSQVLQEARGSRLEDLAVGENSRRSFALKTRLEGLTRGDYEVGLCGYVKRGAGRWNDNDRAQVSVIVTAG